MLRIMTTTKSKTGKAYTFDLHQLQIGDLLEWNGKWYTVQTITRTGGVKLSVTAYLYSSDHGHAVAQGEECQPVTVVPRAFVRAS